MKANIQIVENESNIGGLVIRDIGPWDQYKSITNDPEGVVQYLVQQGKIAFGRRLFYYDSAGDFDELVVKEGEFAGFKPARAKLIDVHILEEPDHDDGKRLVAWPIYSGVDRPRSGGISCGKVGPQAQRLAERVKRACLAGKAIKLETNARCDTSGKTFPNAFLQLRGRTLNADLKALGF